MRDFRGKTRYDLSRAAATFYSVTGIPKITESKTIEKDAETLMEYIFKMKATDSDKEYGYLTLMEWINNAGKLDPNYRGEPSDSSSDDEDGNVVTKALKLISDDKEGSATVKGKEPEKLSVFEEDDEEINIFNLYGEPDANPEDDDEPDEEDIE